MVVLWKLVWICSDLVWMFFFFFYFFSYLDNFSYVDIIIDENILGILRIVEEYRRKFISL